jgi:hypothetical protein
MLPLILTPILTLNLTLTDVIQKAEEDSKPAEQFIYLCWTRHSHTMVRVRVRARVRVRVKMGIIFD